MLCPRLLLPVALLFALGACVPDQPSLALGTWELDKAVSQEATLPLWQAESNRRFDEQVDGMVKRPSGYVNYLRAHLRDTQADYPKDVEREFSKIEISLDVRSGHRFVLHTQIPKFSEKQSSGSYLLTEPGELHLVRREVDGVKQDEQTRLSGRIDDQGRIVIVWQELMSFVLVHRG